jgi:hypothetical protein
MNFIHRKKVCAFHTLLDPEKLETKIQTLLLQKKKIQTLSRNSSSQMNHVNCDRSKTQKQRGS